MPKPTQHTKQMRLGRVGAHAEPNVMPASNRTLEERQMSKQTLLSNGLDKAAAQYLLRRGLATYAEIAALSGRSRQLIRLWAQELEQPETARTTHLAKLWEKATQQTEQNK